MSDNNGTRGQDGHDQIKGTVIQQGRPPRKYDSNVQAAGGHVERIQEHTRPGGRTVHGISGSNINHNMTGLGARHDQHPDVRAHKARERGE